MRIGIIVVFVWLVLVWLALLGSVRELQKIGAALETHVVTLVLMLRHMGEEEELMDELDDLEKEATNAHREDAG